MPDDNYEYPYGDAQTHEALADLDRRLKALEPKAEADPAIERPSVFVWSAAAFCIPATATSGICNSSIGTSVFVEKAPVEYPTDFDVVE